MTPGRGSALRRTVLAAAVLVGASGAAACSRDQDPGIVPSESTVKGATTPPPQLPRTAHPAAPTRRPPPPAASTRRATSSTEAQLEQRPAFDG